MTEWSRTLAKYDIVEFNPANKGEQTFITYRLHEIPWPKKEEKQGQPYDVWSLANGNAGDELGVLYFMDGALITKHVELTEKDRNGYMKVVTMFLVTVKGGTGLFGRCNRGMCAVDDKCNDEVAAGAVSPKCKVGFKRQQVGFSEAKYKSDGYQWFSFPATGVQQCAQGEALGTNGCSWRQETLLKSVFVHCLKAKVKEARPIIRNEALAKLKRKLKFKLWGGKSTEQPHKFQEGFILDENTGGCENILAGRQQMPEATVSDDMKMIPAAWRGASTLKKEAEKPVAPKFTRGHLFRHDPKARRNWQKAGKKLTKRRFRAAARKAGLAPPSAVKTPSLKAIKASGGPTAWKDFKSRTKSNPSGSGKSSRIRLGAAPKLRSVTRGRSMSSPRPQRPVDFVTNEGAADSAAEDHMHAEDSWTELQL